MPQVPYGITEETLIPAVKILDEALRDMIVTDTIPTETQGDEPKFIIVINTNVTRLYILAKGSWRYLDLTTA